MKPVDTPPTPVDTPPIPVVTPTAPTHTPPSSNLCDTEKSIPCSIASTSPGIKEVGKELPVSSTDTAASVRSSALLFRPRSVVASTPKPAARKPSIGFSVAQLLHLPLEQQRLPDKKLTNQQATPKTQVNEQPTHKTQDNEQLTHKTQDNEQPIPRPQILEQSIPKTPGFKEVVSTKSVTSAQSLSVIPIPPSPAKDLSIGARFLRVPSIIPFSDILSIPLPPQPQGKLSGFSSNLYRKTFCNSEEVNRPQNTIKLLSKANKFLSVEGSSKEPQKTLVSETAINKPNESSLIDKDYKCNESLIDKGVPKLGSLKDVTEPSVPCISAVSVSNNIKELHSLDYNRHLREPVQIVASLEQTAGNRSSSSLQGSIVVPTRPGSALRGSIISRWDANKSKIKSFERSFEQLASINRDIVPDLVSRTQSETPSSATTASASATEDSSSAPVAEDSLSGEDLSCTTTTTKDLGSSSSHSSDEVSSILGYDSLPLCACASA